MFQFCIHWSRLIFSPDLVVFCGLLRHTSLQILDLGGNQIGDDGAFAIREGLRYELLGFCLGIRHVV